MTADVVARRIRLTGKVQGVGFRIWTRRQAEKLGLRGWVRNEPDGSVAAFVEGPAAAVAQMEALLWKGPDGAVVAEVVSAEVEPQDVQGFRIVG